MFLSQVVADIKKGKGKRTKKVASPKTNQEKTPKSSPNTKKKSTPKMQAGPKTATKPRIFSTKKKVEIKRKKKVKCNHDSYISYEEQTDR